MSELFFDLVWGLFDIWTIILEMAWQISIIVLLVLLCRLFVGKISKQASYMLWAIVAIRLLVPVMPESELSIFNIAEPAFWGMNTTVSEDMTVPELPMQENTGTIYENSIEVSPDNAGTTDNTYENFTDTTNIGEQLPITGTNQPPMITDLATEPGNPLLMDWMFVTWLIGMAAMGCYGMISYFVLRYRLRFATTSDHKIYEAEHITSPFVLGIIKPRIYLPYRLSEEEWDYILRHEYYHIRRKDYLVKILAFALLAVYWFHPLVWVAFYMMSRDMELSCDEQVLKELGVTERKAYSTLLLSFASQRRFPLPSPVSFGENDIKSRIKNILNYKKPTFWSLMAMFALILALVAGCLTDAKEDLENDDIIENNETNNVLTEEELFAFAEQLFHVKNPYLGDVSANGKILSLLREHYNISRTCGNELQTYEEPFWITISFDEKPDDTAMWKLASVFLALVENCSEFRWEFVTENDILYTYYLKVSDVEEVLGCKDLKDYVTSSEKIAELLMLLDEKETSVTKTTNDASHEINKHLSYSLFSHYADKADIPWEVANQYELRLMKDGVLYRDAENNAIYECIYKDFDNSGKMDMALYIRDLDYNDSTLYIYINDDPLYTHILPMSCWSMEILSGDIDHDGNTELVYSANNGGNGGAGGYVKGILKYKNHTFTPMELPGDFSEEERSDGESGYHIEVYYGKEENLYHIICPSVKDFGVIESEYLKNEDGSYIVRPNHGELVGANCRGFYNLHIIQENNKDYLMAEEYFHGEGGVNHSLGYIRFIFEWNKKNGWTVKDATLHQYVPTASEDSDVFEAMKHEILYYPDESDELVQNWSNIPIINYMDSSIHDPNNQFTQFAYIASTGRIGSGSIIYAKQNEKEELSYVYINYQNDKYYYLEDYSRCSDKPYYIYDQDYFQRVYTGEFRTAEKYTNGDCFEYFYLTNEENLTNQAIYERLLSSKYPADFDTILVYRKQLDEKGMEEYTRCTGDFVAQGIKITMPANYSWIGDPLYKIENGVISGTYTDFYMEADMNVLIGEQDTVFEEARIGLKENLRELDYETWSARTSDGEYVEIELYLEQLGATNFNTVVAKWEYEGNTYLLYGDTKSTDGSPVAKTAIHIIQHFEKHE